MTTSKKRLAEIILSSSLKASVSLTHIGDAAQEKQIRVLPYYSRVKCNAYITTEAELKNKRLLVKNHLWRFKKDNMYFTSLLGGWFGAYIFMDDGSVYLIRPYGLYHRDDANNVKDIMVPKVDITAALNDYESLFPRLILLKKYKTGGDCT